jgi:hypothetical protein
MASMRGSALFDARAPPTIDKASTLPVKLAIKRLRWISKGIRRLPFGGFRIISGNSPARSGRGDSYA